MGLERVGAVSLDLGRRFVTEKVELGQRQGFQQRAPFFAVRGCLVQELQG